MAKEKAQLHGIHKTKIGRCFSCLVALSFYIWITAVGVYSKVSQVAFTQLVVDEWQTDNYIEFVTFMINLVNIDRSGKAAARAIRGFLFFGEDGKEDPDESEAVRAADYLLSMATIKKHGCKR